MRFYSSNGIESDPRALNTSGNYHTDMFDPTGGKKIPMDTDELQSTQRYILQTNAGGQHTAETLINIGGGGIAVCVILLMIAGGIAKSGVFLFALFLLIGPLIISIVLLIVGIYQSKNIKSLPQCVITAYRFKIKEKFYTETVYPKGGKVTNYYIVFGNNVVRVSREQYDAAPKDGSLYCVTAQRGNTLYFTLSSIVSD